MRVEYCHDVEKLRPLAERWMAESNAEKFGLDVDIDVIKQDLEQWLSGEGVVLVAYDGIQPVAFLAVFAVPSYLGKQKIALEKYWYAMPGFTVAGPKLYCEAVRWAKDNGCSHLITSGSKLASGRHEGICRFLETTGAQHFETSYIYEIKET